MRLQMSDAFEYLIGLFTDNSPMLFEEILRLREHLSPEQRKKLLDLITAEYFLDPHFEIPGRNMKPRAPLGTKVGAHPLTKRALSY